MKVVHLNTDLNITSAPYKLHKALLSVGIDSKLLIFNYSNELAEGNRFASPEHTFSYKIRRRMQAIKRKSVLQKYNLNEYMPFSACQMGLDISGHPFIKEADVVCIHWVCADYLSPVEIEKILKTGKKVLMFCHDNQPFTGGCHVRLGCDNYKNGCGTCPQLGSSDVNDISSELVRLKKKSYEYTNLKIVSVSSWMDKNVSESLIFKGKEHVILPNAIDMNCFCINDAPSNISNTSFINIDAVNHYKSELRKQLGLPKDKYIVLITVKANEKIPYNGMDYLWNALQKYTDEKRTDAKSQKNICFVTFGVNEISDSRGNEIVNLGYIKDQKKLASVYGAADVFLVTSLEDSFNQTVAECMASGTPVVAFNNGGIADIINHKENGYLAKLRDADDLVEGLKYIEALSNQERISFINNGIGKIRSEFSYDVVASKFLSII